MKYDKILILGLFLVNACAANEPVVAAQRHAPAPAPAPAPAGVPPSPATVYDPNDTDPNHFYGEPRCGTGLRVCDSFESPTLDTQTWTPETTNIGDTLQLDSIHVARGKRALHIHAPNSGGFEHAMISHLGMFPAPNNTFYGRAFMYYAGTMPQAHSSLFAATGVLPGQTNTTWVRYGNQYALWLANYVGDDTWQHAGCG